MCRKGQTSAKGTSDVPSAEIRTIDFQSRMGNLLWSWGGGRGAGHELLGSVVICMPIMAQCLIYILRWVPCSFACREWQISYLYTSVFYNYLIFPLVCLRPCLYSLGHFQVGSYRYRSLIEGLYTL